MFVGKHRTAHFKRNSMTNLCGQYQIAKRSRLISPNLTLVVSNRRKPESTKPKQYLLLITGDNSFEYVSSMYPVPGVHNTFTIDYKGTNYLLVIDSDKATILDKETVGDNQVNQAQSLQNSITVNFTHKL